ncbi:glycine--tRNA ligase [Candidatus Kaiserbacteria bacterium]|nr:glycine--tRNA ligase [Candidatus Kaiserbacteria bacterium]
MADAHLMEKIVSLCKRRGFIFPGSEIYGGLAGTYDYGPLGVLLKENIEHLWLQMFRDSRDDMYGVDAAILMNPKVWEASGHVRTFADPMADGKMFNTMFKTSVGAGEEASTVYLRPETAGGIFTNFKNVVDSMHPKLPFGIAQIGKAFRNEIAPRDFVFRLRELSQMEVEYFVSPTDWEQAFEEWRKVMHLFAEAVGIPQKSLHELEVPDGERAHYSKRTIDFEFEYPFGRKELWGLAYRTDFDLSAHANASGVELAYQDEETKEKIIPHVIEPSLGIDRTILAILASAYREDDMGGEARTYLALAPKIAPVKAMVSPLLKNKPELVAKAREVYSSLKSLVPSIQFDDNGNIGKRYRRQDEIGTPFCITIDFDTLGESPKLKNTVTLRHRDTGSQERLTVSEAASCIKEAIM